jgi:hypothetical protein
VFVYDGWVNATLGAVDALLDEIIGTDIASMSDAAIRAEAIEGRRVSDRLESRNAAILAAVHRRGIASGDGAASTASWMQWQTGQSRSDAHRTLRTGLACATLPSTAKAWAQGEISTSAAHAICAGRPDGHEAAYGEIEDTLVAFAAAHQWRELLASIGYARRCADAIDGREPAELNGLHHLQVGDRWATTANLDDLAGATVDVALDAATDRPSPDDPRTATQRRAGAFVTICQFVLDHAHLALEAGQRPHVELVFHWDTIVNRLPSSTRTGPALSPTQVAEQLCDATISRIILGPDGLPLAVGRAERYATPAQRRALTVRDGGCRFPGCDRKPSWTIAHHVVPWDPHHEHEPGGNTDLDNLVLLCRHHHRIIHTPGWTTTLDGHTLTITRPDGDVLRSHPRPG